MCVLGSSVELSTITERASQNSLGVQLSSVESRSCHDLRIEEACGRNSLLTVPSANKSTSLPNHAKGVST